MKSSNKLERLSIVVLSNIWWRGQRVKPRRVHLTCAPLGKDLSFLSNIRLDWKALGRTNTLAYSSFSSASKKKSFRSIVHRLERRKSQLFPFSNRWSKTRSRSEKNIRSLPMRLRASCQLPCRNSSSSSKGTYLALLHSFPLSGVSVINFFIASMMVK